MREHAIPQDVTGYRFHIVGNMTLKQFAEVAVGIVGAVILYKTNLVAVVKWPLMFLSGGIGAAIAWLPFEERPLDHWLTVFFSVLYHPTKFFWRKQATIPAPFLFKPRQDQVNVPEAVDLTPARRARIQEYITSVKPAAPQEDWEIEQQNREAEILQAFENQPPSPPPAPPVEVPVELPPIEVVAPPPATPAPALEPTPEPEPQTTFITNPIPTTAAAPTVAAVTNANLPFPVQPTTPNKLVGMALDTNGKIITDAIVEIKNLQGSVARAVKTNALGQFFITTPLESGSYTITADKLGFTFDTQSLVLNGQIVAPIQLTAAVTAAPQLVD